MSDEIQKLVDGIDRFRSEHYESDDSLYQRLTRDGQSPRVMVIACCDSRVDPAIITDCNPDDLFVVRNVANLVPPHETGGHYHGTSAARIRGALPARAGCRRAWPFALWRGTGSDGRDSRSGWLRSVYRSVDGNRRRGARPPARRPG